MKYGGRVKLVQLAYTNHDQRIGHFRAIRTLDRRKGIRKFGSVEYSRKLVFWHETTRTSGKKIGHLMFMSGETSITIVRCQWDSDERNPPCFTSGSMLVRQTELLNHWSARGIDRTRSPKSYRQNLSHEDFSTISLPRRRPSTLSFSDGQVRNQGPLQGV